MNHVADESCAFLSENDLRYQSFQHFTKQNTQHLLDRIPKSALIIMFLISEQKDQAHILLFQSFINPF